VSKVKIEAFLSTPTGSSDSNLSSLLREIKEEFGNRVEIAIYKEGNELFEEYNLTSTPAVVIEELIKIMGFCPSKETLLSALREVGME